MSSVPYDPPSLDLPVPPPTPVHTVSSSDEYNASLHRSASYASSFQSTLVEQPTVDELLREVRMFTFAPCQNPQENSSKFAVRLTI